MKKVLLIGAVAVAGAGIAGCGAGAASTVTVTAPPATSAPGSQSSQPPTTPSAITEEEVIQSDAFKRAAEHLPPEAPRQEILEQAKEEVAQERMNPRARLEAKARKEAAAEEAMARLKGAAEAITAQQRYERAMKKLEAAEAEAKAESSP